MGRLSLFIGLAVCLSHSFVSTALGESEFEKDHLVDTQQQIDLLGQEVHRLKAGTESPWILPDRGMYGYGPAISKVYRVKQGVSFAGFGEILFESFGGGFDSPTKRLAPGEDFSVTDGQSRFDLTRVAFVLGYKFDDAWVLNSEVSIEHGGKNIYLPFLYLDHFWQPAINFRFGSLLMPMGLTNESHEPTTFIGTHRTLLETLIIPTTWSEYGGGIFGELGPVVYRSYLVTGLNASGFSPANGIRDGRYSNGFANASTWGWVTRADTTKLVPGLLGGLSFYVGEASTVPEPGFSVVTAPTAIAEVHLEWNWNKFTFRGMGAYSNFWKMDQVAIRNAASVLGSTGSQQGGYFLEAAYNFFEATKRSLSPYIRWETVATQLAVPSGYLSSGSNYAREIVVGLNFKPHSQIVFKADYQWNILGDSAGVDQLNISMGTIF